MFSSSSLTINFITETDGYPRVFSKKSASSLVNFRKRIESEFRRKTPQCCTFHMVRLNDTGTLFTSRTGNFANFFVPSSNGTRFPTVYFRFSDLSWAPQQTEQDLGSIIYPLFSLLAFIYFHRAFLTYSHRLFSSPFLSSLVLK
jgi:hypothetical protein